MNKQSDILSTKDGAFYTTFVGELVEATTQFRMTDAEAIGTLTAYLLDMDEHYFYFGETADEIGSAIKRESVYSIRIVKLEPWKDKMLRDMGDPTDETDIN